MKPAHVTPIFLGALIAGLPFQSADGASAIVWPGNGEIRTDTSSGPNALYGYGFTVGGNDILVTALGLWDDGNDGFSDDHQVGLGTTDHFFASVTMPRGTGSSLIGEFRYTELAEPVILRANTYYGIFAKGFGGSMDSFYSASLSAAWPEASPGIALGVSVYSQGADSEFPFPIVIGGSPHVGPNFQFTIIPEPSSVILCLAGLATAGLIRQRPAAGPFSPPNP